MNQSDNKTMDRFFAVPERWSQNGVVLSPDESHHCVRVMRKQAEDFIEVFDGEGRSAIAKIIELSKNQVNLGELDEIKQSAHSLQINLHQAVPKGKNMDLVVQKSVELGVSLIQPILSENTVVKLSESEAPKRQDKWQRVALEACKQCGQNRLPEVKLPVSYQEWVSSLDAGQGIVASLYPGAQKFRDVLEKFTPSEAIGLLIGPEGDLSALELEQVVERGWKPVTLGEIVLRSETASIYGLSAINHQWG